MELEHSEQFDFCQVDRCLLLLFAGGLYNEYLYGEFEENIPIAISDIFAHRANSAFHPF